jgi:benzoyl-CoA reductase/2-hydroxyglutaryl-CoA dehydratase subunit BcrC/BadD/HgdB
MEPLIGITSTIPLEIPLAAGLRVVDLNNVFVQNQKPMDFVKNAEAAGFPRNCCTWIKGIFGLVRCQNLRRIIFVTGGDCSNTHALMETLMKDLDEIIPFSYPYPAQREEMERELKKFANTFGVSWDRILDVEQRLRPVRNALRRLDDMTWQDNRVTGKENFLWLLGATDFEGDVVAFEQRLAAFLKSAATRSPCTRGPRLGVVGVPPIQSDFHEAIENAGGNVVYNEIPRQFAMILDAGDIVSRYLKFSYPYGVWARVEDIREQIVKRNLQGIIHYTQSFCHRQIHDIVMRRELRLPTLTIEGEAPGPLDQRTRLRLEGFLEILKQRTV